MGATEDCEAALAAHWAQLGRLPGGTLREDDRLVWFQTPVGRLPYNGVVRTRLAEADADAEIAGVLAAMRARGAELWWALHPSATPHDLGDRLAAAGMRPVERMNYMALDLDGWTSPPPKNPRLEIAPVTDPAGERAYTELTFLYWEVPPAEQAAVAALHAAIDPAVFPGLRFLARLDGRPVAKAYLSWPGPPAVASVYGMSVHPDARGHGAAVALTVAMVEHARELGCHRVVLHSTDMAVRVYERAGFRGCGTGTAYATAAIWSHEQV